MSTWIFEPGHTEADSCLDTTFEGRIDATKLWTGEAELTLDVEAIHEGDLEKTGAIAHYR